AQRASEVGWILWAAFDAACIVLCGSRVLRFFCGLCGLGGLGTTFCSLSATFVETPWRTRHMPGEDSDARREPLAPQRQLQAALLHMLTNQ
ncbi:MAG: hypothetical protein ACKO3C_03835, partial [Betaproteobacteria bacterium]